MIVLVTGPPGAGKSFYAVRKIGQALDAGKPVATNIELADDATERVARANPFRWLVPGRRARRAQLLERGLHVTQDLEELTRIRLRGSGEGRGVIVLDEAGGWLNARDWNDAGRRDVLEWFRKHRKYGWDVYLLVQDEEQLDKHVRKLFEYHVHLRNLRRLRLLGVPVVPVNLFLALWTWHGLQANKVVKREVYRLSWHRRLYDTNQLDFGADDPDGENALWLPRAPLAQIPAAAGTDGPSGPAAPVSPDLDDLARLDALAALPRPDGPAPTFTAQQVVGAGHGSSDHAPIRRCGIARSAAHDGSQGPLRPAAPGRFPSVPGVLLVNENRPGWHPGGSNDQRQAGRDRAPRG